MRKYANEIELFCLAFFGIIFGSIGVENIFLAALLCAVIKLLIALFIRKITKSKLVKENRQAQIKISYLNYILSLVYFIAGIYIGYIAANEVYTFEFLKSVSESENFIVDEDNTDPVFSEKIIALFFRTILFVASLTLLIFSIFNLKKKIK